MQKYHVVKPNINFGIKKYPLLQLIVVFFETLDVSTATSQAEFPPPITNTLLSLKGAALLYS